MLRQPLSSFCPSVLNTELRDAGGRTNAPRNIMRHNCGNWQVQKMKNAHEWRRTASDQVTCFNQVGHKIKISIFPRMNFVAKSILASKQQAVSLRSQRQVEGPHRDEFGVVGGEKLTEHSYENEPWSRGSVNGNTMHH